LSAGTNASSNYG